MDCKISVLFSFPIVRHITNCKFKIAPGHMNIIHLAILLEGVIAFKSNLKLTKENHLPFKSFKFKNPLKYTILRKRTVSIQFLTITYDRFQKLEGTK